MNIYLTEIAKEEGKINLCADCYVCVVVPFKADTGFPWSLHLELGLSTGVSFPHLQRSMRI